MAPDIDIVPFDHNIDTLERAVKERVFFVKNKEGEFVPPPRPDTEVFLNRMEPVRDLLKPHLPSTAPWTYRQFVDSYKGRKKDAYEKALVRLRTGHSSKQDDAKVEVFIKYEKTDRTSKQDPVPRVISPRNPKFNLRVGRYLKKIEEPVFKALGKLFGHKTVMKGLDMECTAKKLKEKWDMFNDPVAIGLDASRFDQHVSKTALKFEHSIYPLCFPTKVWKNKLNNLLQCQLVNHCVGYAPDGMLNYTVEGTRMSGDMNTSLGNCVLMCMMIKAYSIHKNINLQLANNGDDCVVFLEKRDLDKFSQGVYEWFLEMGFNMQIEEPYYEFGHIEFCQCKPVYDGTVWIMCRNPTIALAKDSVYLCNESSPDRISSWAHAIGIGGTRLAGKIPIFQSFYDLFRRTGKQWYRRSRDKKMVCVDTGEHTPWFMREQNVVGKREAGEITPEARASFYDSWGITPDEQISYEELYDTMSLDFSLGGEYCPRNHPLDQI